jgi:peroxiredoxin
LTAEPGGVAVFLMKRFLPVLLAIALLGYTPSGFAGDAKAELQELVGKVKAKLQGGAKTENDFADELKGFDSLLAEHKGEKTDDVAQILLMKAFLYTQVFDDDAKATQFLQELKAEFPDTGPGKNADKVIASLAAQGEAKKIQRSLAEGTKFPDFQETDLDGKPLSISNYKGKLVMIDFWATWCGPCVHELPNVLTTYGKYHDKGFEIIGVSLDNDKDKLTSFIKEKNVNWPQYFDGKGWQNKLASKYGVNSIPSTYLLDGEGTIIGKSLRGNALEAAVAKALAAK